MYLETNYAGSLRHDDIPATEWPMFGATFYLVTAEDLQRRGEIDPTQGTIREAVEKAAEIVASPVTATWVKTKWGSGYLEKENVFYRMLLILGLSSYEKVTGQHAVSCDDVPAASGVGGRTGRGEVPSARRLPRRVLSGRHALGRGGDSAGRPARRHATRRAGQRVDGRVRRAGEGAGGLPAFQADSRSGRILQGARGCGNSGIIPFAAELDRRRPDVGMRPTRKTSGRTPAGWSALRKCRSNRATS